LQESVNNNTTNITTLQSYPVSSGTNVGVGPGVLGNLTTGTQNTVVGNWEDALPYMITSGSNNTFIGYNTGKSCEQGSNNTFVGANAQLQPGQTLFTRSIALGAGVEITNSDQFVVASNVTSFIIPGLTASTGTGEGTILDFDSSGNIIPSAGTYNTVSKIDTELSSLQSSINTNTSDINTLLSGGTLFTASGSYTVPSNVTTLVIEAMGGGGGGAASSGPNTSGPWNGGGGGGSGVLQKITIPATSGQVINFTIETGGTAGTPSVSPSNGSITTVTMYGQTILNADGGSGASGMDGGGIASSSSGISCGGGGGMGYYGSTGYGTGGTGTFPGQNSTTYVAGGTNEQSGNGGLNNLGASPISGYASGMGGAGGGPTPGSYGCGGNGAFSPADTQLDGYAGGNGYVKISIY